MVRDALIDCLSDEAGVAASELSSAPSNPSIAMETERLKGEATRNGYIVPSLDHQSEV